MTAFTRRTFLASLCALPVVGKWIKKPSPVRVEDLTGRIISKPVVNLSWPSPSEPYQVRVAVNDGPFETLEEGSIISDGQFQLPRAIAARAGDTMTITIEPKPDKEYIAI